MDHNKTTCDNQEVSLHIKEDFKRTKMAKKREDIGFRIYRRSISKDHYWKNKEKERKRKKLYMQRRRKKLKELNKKIDPIL